MFLDLNEKDSKNADNLIPAKAIDKNILLLKLRNAIADKEFIIAQANMETSARGSWALDWHVAFLKADSRIDIILKSLGDETLTKG